MTVKKTVKETVKETPGLPAYNTLQLTRKERLLTITLNRPDSLNAVNLEMHEELAEVFSFAAMDEGSDVIVLTGAGSAFSAGGDLDHLANNAAHPELFDNEVRLAKRIVFALLDLDKPIVCRLNGHAVGLGATLALLCDVVFAADDAKIGDPHVAVGLVAGDGGAVIWPQLIGLARAKEYLLTGELLSASKAEQIGLINYCLPLDELDAAVAAFCNRLLAGATTAIRCTKVLLNLELKRVANTVMDAGIAYEAVTVRSADHREGVRALQEKRKPVFGTPPARRAGQVLAGVMPLSRYKMLVMSQPVAGREDEYNDWYQHVHLDEVVALPGFTSARRFRRARSLVAGDTYPYLAVYEIETDDIDAVLDGLRAAAENKDLNMSDALDTGHTRAVVYEEFGAVVNEQGDS